MHPILFHIPGLDWPIRSFGVLVALGFLLGSWIWARLIRRYGRDPRNDAERVSQVGLWTLVGVMAGGRAMFVLVEIFKHLASPQAAASTGARFLDQPWTVFAIWEGGMAMYGGFLGAVLLGLWGAKKAGLARGPALDTGLVGGFVGQTIGRWGCLLVGDDYGRVVPERWAHLPFPITLRVPSSAWLEAHPDSLFEPQLAGQLVWCTQLWMSLSAALVAFVGWRVLRRRRYDGQVAATVFLLYAFNRFLIEFARGDAVRGLWFGGALSSSQLISIPLGLGAAWFLWKNRARRDAAYAIKA